MANSNIRRDDVVVVLSGDSKGTKGKVIACSPKEGKVIVEGAIYSDKVALYCPKCDKGVRVHNKVVDGKKVRVCAKCGQEI